MSEAIRMYAAVLYSALAIFLAIGTATVFIGVGLRSYAEALTFQVRGHRHTRKRRWRVIGSWMEMLFALVISAACYGYVCFELASSFVSALRLEQRSMTITVMAAIGLMIPYFGAVHSARSDYLRYRRSTDFRVWIRGVPKSGLSAAHEHYFAGWRLRVLGELFLAVLIYISVSAYIAALPRMVSGRVLGRRDWMFIAGCLAAFITIPLVRSALAWFWRIFRPEYSMAERCASIPKQKKLMPWKAARRFKIYRPGEWRSREHEDSFKIASLLEWSVRRAQGRHAQHSYDELVMAARRLAQSLRLSALEVTGEPDGTRAAYEERKFLALQIATGRDPLKFAGRIAELTVEEPEPPELPRQRAARLIESISGAINMHWPALKTIVIVAAIALLVWSGKLTDAVGLLK